MTKKWLPLTGGCCRQVEIRIICEIGKDLGRLLMRGDCYRRLLRQVSLYCNILGLKYLQLFVEFDFTVTNFVYRLLVRLYLRMHLILLTINLVRKVDQKSETEPWDCRFKKNNAVKFNTLVEPALSCSLTLVQYTLTSLYKPFTFTLSYLRGHFAASDWYYMLYFAGI